MGGYINRITVQKTAKRRIAWNIALVTAFLSLTGCTGTNTTVTFIAVHPTRPNFVYISTNDRVYKTRDGGKTWIPIVEGLGGGRVISLAIHPEFPSTIYAGTFGDAVYRSLDGGQRWSIINAGMKAHVSIINSFVFHPENPDIFFAGATVGVFKTTNGGLMWEEMPNKGMESVYVVPVILDHDDPNIFYVGTSGGVYRSGDGGETWERLHEGMIDEMVAPALELGVNTLVQDPLQSDIMYAGTTGGAYKSVNRGRTWTKIDGGLAETFISHIVLDHENPEIVYTATSKGMFKSPDRGESWTAINEGLTKFNIRSLAMNPKNSQVLYAGTQRGLFKTTNGGMDWKKLDILGEGKEPA